MGENAYIVKTKVSTSNVDLSDSFSNESLAVIASLNVLSSVVRCCAKNQKGNSVLESILNGGFALYLAETRSDGWFASCYSVAKKKNMYGSDLLKETLIATLPLDFNVYPSCHLKEIKDKVLYLIGFEKEFLFMLKDNCELKLRGGVPKKSFKVTDYPEFQDDYIEQTQYERHIYDFSGVFEDTAQPQYIHPPLELKEDKGTSAFYSKDSAIFADELFTKTGTYIITPEESYMGIVDGDLLVRERKFSTTFNLSSEVTKAGLSKTREGITTLLNNYTGIVSPEHVLYSSILNSYRMVYSDPIYNASGNGVGVEFVKVQGIWNVYTLPVRVGDFGDDVAYVGFIDESDNRYFKHVVAAMDKLDVQHFCILPSLANQGKKGFFSRFSKKDDKGTSKVADRFILAFY